MYHLSRLVVIAIAACGTLSACATTVAHSRPQPQSHVYVCHGGRKAKWQRVSASAADAHRRHGDRVTGSQQRSGASCS